MGATRKDPNLTLVRGNPGNRTIPAKGKSVTGRPTPPADLKGEAFAEWSRITSYLTKVGRIESVDHAALVVYCSAWAMFDESRKSFELYGPLISGRDGGMVKNPAAQLMKESADVMLKYGAKFGFTPRDRMNLGITSGDDEGEGLAGALAAL